MLRKLSAYPSQTFRPDPKYRRLGSAELRAAIEFWLVAGLSDATVKHATELLAAVKAGQLTYQEATRRITQ